MAMKILGQDSPKEVFLQASDILADAVRHTLGPKGSNTAVCTNSSGSYQIINDGKSIVQDLTSDSPVIAPAMELLKQSCYETNRVAGDGTTSTILMTNALLHRAYDYIEKYKVNPVVLRKEIESIKDQLIEYVDSIKTDLTEDKYEDVAAVALGGRKYAKMIADAYKFVGPDGTVVFTKEDRQDVYLDCQDGVTLDKTEMKIIPMKEPREFFDVKAVFLYEKVDRFAEIIDLLNKTVEFKGRKVLFFYNELSWDASSNIYANIGSGNIDIIPIRVGGYGVQTKDVMEQLAEYADCTLIDGLNVKLSTIKDYGEMFGTFKKSLVSEDKIVVQSEKEIKENKDYMLQLKNKSCIIKIGGNNKVEQEETFRRIEDAVSSLGTAIKDGITIGGGLAYLNVFESIRAVTDVDFLENIGETIYRTIVYNTRGIKDIPKDYIGLFPGKDDTADWIDLDKSIFDSAVVIKEVIRNSFSLVAQIITTEKLIHEMIR